MLLWDTYLICGYASLRLDGRILSLNLVCWVEPLRMTRTQSVSVVQRCNWFVSAIAFYQVLYFCSFWCRTLHTDSAIRLVLLTMWKTHFGDIRKLVLWFWSFLCSNCWLTINLCTSLIHFRDLFQWCRLFAWAARPSLVDSLGQWGPQRCPRSTLRVCVTCYNEVTITGCNIGCSHVFSRQGRPCDNISCMTQARRQGLTCHLV